MGKQIIFSAKEILQWRSDQLSFGGTTFDLDWLLDIGGGLGWDSLQKLKVFQNDHYELNKSLEDLSSIWIKHIDGQIPLQQLIGQCPWRDFQLEINSSVLIPRQETELLIEFALRAVGRKNSGCWADLGTGSGALAVALARSFPRWKGYAVDISEEALLVARKNLKRLASNSHVDLLIGDWWKPLKPWWGKFDLVLANPPYIPNSVLQKLEPIVRDHEPHLALCGGVDGMGPSRKIIGGAIQALRPGGWLMLEHHYDQSERVLDCLLQNGFSEVSSEKDIQGARRFALGRCPGCH